MAGMVLDLDTDIANADWAKRYTWDLPASTPEELYAYLAQRGLSVEQFKALPVYAVNQHLYPWLQTIEQPEVPK